MGVADGLINTGHPAATAGLLDGPVIKRMIECTKSHHYTNGLAGGHSQTAK